MRREIERVIDAFIENEKTRVLRETELCGRGILTEFLECMQLHKGDSWDIGDISIADIFVYYSSVDGGAETEHYARFAKRTVSRFIRFSMGKGVLRGRDWQDLEHEYKRKGI